MGLPVCRKKISYFAVALPVDKKPEFVDSNQTVELMHSGFLPNTVMHRLFRVYTRLGTALAINRSTPGFDSRPHTAGQRPWESRPLMCPASQKLCPYGATETWLILFHILKHLLIQSTHVARWRSGRVLDLRSVGCEFESKPPAVESNPGQVVNTHVPLSPSSIIWYQPLGGEALRLGR